MGDEYMEQKIRVYQPKKKKEGGKVNRFVLQPIERMVGMGPKKDEKQKRLTA